MNAVISSIAASFPAMRIFEKGATGLDEWILPAFAIPTRNPADASVKLGWNQGPVTPERAKTGGKGLNKVRSLFFRKEMRGSEGFCLNKGRSPAMTKERFLPCFGPEEEPGPDSLNPSEIPIIFLR